MPQHSREEAWQHCSETLRKMHSPMFARRWGGNALSCCISSKHDLHRNFAPRHPDLPVKAVDCGGALATALRGGGLAMLLGNPAKMHPPMFAKRWGGSALSCCISSKHGLHRNFAPRHPYLPVRAVDCGGALAPALRGGGLAMLLGNPAENALSDVRQALGRQRAFLLHFLETRPAP